MDLDIIINENNKKNRSTQEHKYKKRFDVKNIKCYACGQKEHYKKNYLRNKYLMTIIKICEEKCHPILFQDNDRHPLKKTV